MRIARLIDANALKDLREKYIRGEIHFDYEGDMVDKCPTVEAVPIEELKHLRDELYEHDLITMEGLKQLNTLIKKYTTVYEGGLTMAELEPCPCIHASGIQANAIGETLAYCEFTAEWMNVSLGECSGNCDNEEVDND